MALALGLSAAALLFAGCGGEGPGTDAPAVAATAPAAVETGDEEGQRAPGFALTTVEGEQVSLAAFEGQPLVVYFYTTW